MRCDYLILQAVLDGVDIISLSIGPNEPTKDTLTFLNIFDITLLFARKAGVLVVQAAGTNGPSSSTVVSFSPWSVGVAACNTDRQYHSSILLRNGRIVGGVGLTGTSYFIHAKYFLFCFFCYAKDNRNYMSLLV